jgi:hypothetical protein
MAVATAMATMADAVGGVANTACGIGRAAATASLAAARWEVEARDNRRRDNQPANERQTGGEAPEDKRRRGLDRPRLRVERRRQSHEDKRRRHRCDNQPANEGGGESDGDGNSDGAGEREANGRRGASGQEATGPG